MGRSVIFPPMARRARPKPATATGLHTCSNAPHAAHLTGVRSLPQKALTCDNTRLRQVRK